MSRNGKQQSRKSPKRPAKKPMSREDFLKLAFSVVNDKLSAAGRQNLQANFEQQYDYPVECVVCFDEWAGQGRARRLERRVLRHGTRMKPLSDLIAFLPLQDQLRV